jgi:hypothetical protein
MGNAAGTVGRWLAFLRVLRHHAKQRMEVSYP